MNTDILPAIDNAIGYGLPVIAESFIAVLMAFGLGYLSHLRAQYIMLNTLLDKVLFLSKNADGCAPMMRHVSLESAECPIHGGGYVDTQAFK